MGVNAVSCWSTTRIALLTADSDGGRAERGGGGKRCASDVFGKGRGHGGPTPPPYERVGDVN
jgi:hypothetical protein